MNQKFEKFKSKEISKADSEKVIGGDIFECMEDCERKALVECTFKESEWEDIEHCIFHKSQICFFHCMSQYDL